MFSVFLDLNHWIALGRVANNRSDSSLHQHAYHLLRKAVEREKVFLPLQINHLVEFSRNNNAFRRERMAPIFETFSRNWFFADWGSLLQHELLQAICKTFDVRIPHELPIVFGKGAIFSLPKKAKELLMGDPNIRLGLERHQVLSSLPGALLDLLTFDNEANRKKQFISGQSRGEMYRLATEATRKERISRDESYRIEAAGFSYQHQHMLCQQLNKAGKSFEDFAALGPDRLTKFYDDVPSLDVDRVLRISRDRHWDRPIDANDLNDIGYLCLAVPYCDVVITENFWGQLIKSNKLHSKYNTTVYKDLGQAIDWLENL